jgi:aryl-alcohol dehydrogenase-like predicted oxidoreductase
MSFMDYRPFGNTGLRVSAVGFGAWQLNNPIWGGPDEARSIELVQAALDAGCNFYDTAPGYGGGASEHVLGKALQGRRDKAVLCTKYGHADPDRANFSVAGLRASLETSLRRLQTDHVDVLLLHSPPRDLLDGTKAADLYTELEALRREGKLRAYGASVDASDELRTLALTTTSGAAEVLFNACHQDVRRAFGEAARRGVGLIAKVPLDSGWLSGKYDEHSRFDGIRERWSPEVVARRAELVQRLRALLPPDMPLAQAALGFVLAHREIATVIPGAKSRAQLEANLAAAAEPLPATLVAAIHALWESEIADNPLPW